MSWLTKLKSLTLKAYCSLIRDYTVLHLVERYYSPSVPYHGVHGPMVRENATNRICVGQFQDCWIKENWWSNSYWGSCHWREPKSSWLWWTPSGNNHSQKRFSGFYLSMQQFFFRFIWIYWKWRSYSWNLFSLFWIICFPRSNRTWYKNHPAPAIWLQAWDTPWWSCPYHHASS